MMGLQGCSWKMRLLTRFGSRVGVAIMRHLTLMACNKYSKTHIKFNYEI